MPAVKFTHFCFLVFSYHSLRCYLNMFCTQQQQISFLILLFRPIVLFSFCFVPCVTPTFFPPQCSSTNLCTVFHGGVLFPVRRFPACNSGFHNLSSAVISGSCGDVAAGYRFLRRPFALFSWVAPRFCCRVCITARLVLPLDHVNA